MTNRTIWKFPLAIAGAQTVCMPAGAKILSVHMQDGVPCVWAIVDPDAPQRAVTFRMFGTGHGLPAAGMAFVGTVPDRAFVWHVFYDTVDPHRYRSGAIMADNPTYGIMEC